MFALKDRFGITGLGLFTIFIVGCLLIIAIGIAGTYVTCNSFAELNQDYEVQWNFWNGCMVKNNAGFWINKNQIDFIQGELWQLTPK